MVFEEVEVGVKRVPLQHKHTLLFALGPNSKHTKLLHFGCLWVHFS